MSIVPWAHSQTTTQTTATINPKSFLLLGTWIYKYNIRISNIRLKIKYYKLILETINNELNEIKNDYNKLNDSLKLINIKYDINNTSILSYKKLNNNQKIIINTIQELEKDEQLIIHEFYN